MLVIRFMDYWEYYLIKCASSTTGPFIVQSKSVNCYRCWRESGGHPSQQNVHLSPQLECSWSASIQNEWKLSQTQCYFLLNRSEKLFFCFPCT